MAERVEHGAGAGGIADPKIVVCKVRDGDDALAWVGRELRARKDSLRPQTDCRVVGLPEHQRREHAEGDARLDFR